MSGGMPWSSVTDIHVGKKGLVSATAAYSHDPVVLVVPMTPPRFFCSSDGCTLMEAGNCHIWMQNISDTLHRDPPLITIPEYHASIMPLARSSTPMSILPQKRLSSQSNGLQKSGDSDGVGPPFGRPEGLPMPQAPVGAWSTSSGAISPPDGASPPLRQRLPPSPAGPRFPPY